MRIYNTLTRKKDDFKPIGEIVKIYTCGPTVYSRAHIGNMRAFIFEDLLVRVLKHHGYKVKRVMNITDVGHLTSDSDTGEDKMEKGAISEKMSVWQIADKYTQLFLEDMEKLNLLKPDIWCKATDHIKEQEEMVLTLKNKGFTYETTDGIYFDTSRLKDYGKLARLDISGLKEGARVEKGEKKNATDFAVWKFSPKDQKRAMEWDFLGKKGFPGWHIECSAMARKYLGDTFDIHCGGIDHIPVHHTNEIAQSEAVTGKPLANYWMHNEFLVVSEGKMSKSKGNITDIDSLPVEPLAYRYYCLNTHYRKQLMFSEEGLIGAQASLSKLRRKMYDLGKLEKEGRDASSYVSLFFEALHDDLNSPKALGIMWDLISDEEISSKAVFEAVKSFDEILGIDATSYRTIEEDFDDIVIEYEPGCPKEIIELVLKRHNSKKAKDWGSADKIRDEIKEKGFNVDDRRGGYFIGSE